MQCNRIATTLAALALTAQLACPARAEEPVKIGVIAEFSGPFAEYGKQMENGMKAYLAQNGDTVAGRKVELITRDTTGPAPEVAKRFAAELATREKVDFLVGFGLTPNAMAATPISKEAKKPMIVMNAAASVITTTSPYVVRVSQTIAQMSLPMAQWAAKNNIHKVYTLVADYAPGKDAEEYFKKGFEAAGGQVVDSARVPLNNPDFAPFIQRIKDAKPEAVFLFLPAGEQGVAFMKGFTERGLAQAGIKVIGTGDLTDDGVLDAMGDPTLGVITAFHYSAAHDSPENRAFLKAYAGVAPNQRANFMAVAGYDGMAAIFEALKKTGGDTDADKVIAALKGWKHTSPRGPIEIDPETRDIIQTVYIRRVERRDGHLYNIEFDQIPAVKDPGKEGAH
jgi:branched-chain amino acid transport system substrate-binding protein